jgi:hypothetical protein
VPIGAAGLTSAKIVRNASLKIYPGAPHGLTSTHKDKVNVDLLSFPEELASAGWLAVRSACSRQGSRAASTLEPPWWERSLAFDGCDALLGH